MLLETLRRAEALLGGAQYRAYVAALTRAAGLTLAETRLDNVRVPYLFRRANGEATGATAVLVHGFGGDKEVWLPMAASMPRTRGLLIPDLPGFGAAGEIPRARASAAQQARALAGLLDRAGEAGPVHLVGNSMGGGISLRFAQDFPQRTRSITLIGSVGPTVDKSPYFHALDRGENPLVLRRVELFEEFLALISHRPAKLPRAVRRHLAEDRVARAPSLEALFDGYRHPPEGEEVPGNLAAIRAPALVIHGARDQVIDPSTARALAEGLPDARLELLSNIGHVPQMESPRPVAKLVESFLRASSHAA